ncbi:hypothetical protein [Variovorax sp. Sphag1AA]|uniref:hypothetical protein n=1 Tax=Variovorax sp. Sphag1AA TaxID=2587027 RepID=UPI0016114BB5|nr:hypothetical protein [Variovorax sp. Sphag1AA]MBB3182286.1 hypothetical protein [Variovorax sp. Sphag1AA]
MQSSTRANVDPSELHLGQHDLDERYQVLGRFYAYPGEALGKSYLCRDILEIHRTAVGDQPCNAVFVMMNPGDSKPLLGTESAPKHEARLVATRPDRTQFQLMRLMGMLGWQRVRVLNLSDLRNPRSSSFYEQLKGFKAHEGHNGHSIFSTTRKAELAGALARKPGAPIVAAWGVGRPLKDLATNAVDALNGKAVGLNHPRGAWAYRHPLPQRNGPQIQWRLDALELLRPFS